MLDSQRDNKNAKIAHGQCSVSVKGRKDAQRLPVRPQPSLVLIFKGEPGARFVPGNESNGTKITGHHRSSLDLAKGPPTVAWVLNGRSPQ